MENLVSLVIPIKLGFILSFLCLNPTPMSNTGKTLYTELKN